MPPEMSVSILVLRLQPANDVVGRTCTSSLNSFVLQHALSATSSASWRSHTSHHHRSAVPVSFSPTLLSFDISFFFFPHFLWAHRSGNSSPLRPTRLLLCRFRPQHHWVPSNKADASLRLRAPSLSVVPQTKRGRKKR